MNIFLLLFIHFFKTGLFAVGGGLATIPFLTEIELQYPEWFSSFKLIDIIAIAESTPGPIGINTATFSGYSAAGIPGAIVSTLSLILPSLIIITLISKVYQKYQGSPIVSSVFSTLRPAVAGLIAAAGYSVFLSATATKNLPGIQSFDIRCIVIFAAFIVLLQLKPTKKIHPIFYILAGAGLGLLLQL